MRRLAEGDRTALEVVLVLVHPVVTRYCRAFLAGHADADDAAHDALLRMARQASRFDPVQDALTWVLTLATWECRSARRRHSRAMARLVEQPPADIDHGKSPERIAGDHQLLAALDTALAALPSTDRQTLVDDLAVVAGDTRSQARTRKRRQRAIARLRDVWRKLYGPA